MKKLFFPILLFMMSGITVIAQKTVHDANAEKRNVGSFHGIEIATGIELVLTKGDTEEVAVSAAAPEFRDKIITRVENGILKIQYETKTGSIKKRNENKDLKVWVSYKILDRLYATTGAVVEIDGVLASSSLDMKANTGAEIKGKVDITSFRLDQNTGSKVMLTGKAGKLEAEGSTGSKFEGEGLNVDNCSLKVSTGAKITIHAEKELQVKASTGGIVKYKGNAGIRDIKTNTGGTVSKI